MLDDVGEQREKLSVLKITGKLVSVAIPGSNGGQR
jgi:hypothetical protein